MTVRTAPWNDKEYRRLKKLVNEYMESQGFIEFIVIAARMNRKISSVSAKAKGLKYITHQQMPKDTLPRDIRRLSGIKVNYQKGAHDV